MSGTDSDNSNHVSVVVTVGDIKVQFSGSAESVMNSVINFLSKQVPAMDLAKKISLNYKVRDAIIDYLRELNNNNTKLSMQPEGRVTRQTEK